MTFNSFIQKIRYGSNFNKPYYMLKLAGNVLRSKYLGQTPLRGVDFAVSYSCNLECKHCFNDTLLKGEKKMELNDYARVIKESIKLGAISFAFQGGEILLLKGFEDVLRLVDPKRCSLSITTNGSLLSNDMVKKLKDIGVNTVTISLDSGLAEEHDRFRGKNGSFASATQGIERLLQYGIKVVINSTITPAFLRSEGFHKLLKFSKNKKLLINTIFAAPSGRWSNNDKIVLKEGDIKL
ncbi:MAG: radical SAM protein, partial [Thermodesulfobacteriota bacterium]